MRVVLAVLFIVGFASAASAGDIRLVTLNLERGWKPDADLSTISEIIDEIGPADIWAFAEVSANDKSSLLAALGNEYDAVRGTRGSDYLLIAYNSQKLSRLDSGEVFLTEITGGQRKPLWLQLKATDSSTPFYVVVNHFLRGSGDDPRRRGEASDLREWAQSHAPAIALGDFNLDFDVNYSAKDRSLGRKQRSAAFDELVRDDIWVWVRPDILMPTQCSPKYDSVLDFVFVAGAARNWPRESRIIDIGCNDTHQRPDHLPVELIISVP